MRFFSCKFLNASLPFFISGRMAPVKRENKNMTRIKILSGFFLWALLCAAVVSCVKDGVGDADPDDPKTGNSASISLKIRIGETNPGTRAGEQDPEKKISSIRIVLYDKASGKAEYSWDLHATNINIADGSIIPFHGGDVSENPTQPTETFFVSKAREVKRGDYYMLVVANPSQELIGVTKEGTYVSGIRGVLSDMTPAQFIGPDGEIQMANHQGLVEVRADRDFWDTELEAQDHPVFVAIERSLAKIVVMSYNIQFPGSAYVSNLMWNVDIVNKHTYWLRHMAEKADGLPERYLDTDRENFYAVDPNYSGFSVNNGTGDQEKEALKNALPDQFAYIAEDEVEMYALDDMGSTVYVTENTMEAAEQRRDVTTRIVISGTYYPNGPTDDDGHFYTYNNMVITASEMAGYAYDTYTIPEQYAGLADVIDKMWDQGFDFDSPGAETNKAFSVDGLNFYKFGKVYYIVLVRHFNDAQKPVFMSYGRYGVVRNNAYEVKILSIAGPGSPVFPEPNPDPDDLEDWLVVELKVVDWDVYNLQFDY